MERLISSEGLMTLYKDRDKALLAIRRNGKFLPLYKTEKLAGVVADLIGDGHLQGEPYWRIDYTSKNISELERFGKSVSDIFFVWGKIRSCNGNTFGKTYNFGMNCKVVARTLHLCGVPIGSKTDTEFDVPKWVYENKKFFAAFCRRLFSCEATVSAKESIIQIEMWKRIDYIETDPFLRSVKSGLEKHFKIDTTNVFTHKSCNHRKDGTTTKPLRFLIKKKASIDKFYIHIGFDDINKQSKLKQIVERNQSRRQAKCLTKR